LREPQIEPLRDSAGRKVWLHSLQTCCRSGHAPQQRRACNPMVGRDKVQRRSMKDPYLLPGLVQHRNHLQALVPVHAAIRAEAVALVGQIQHRRNVRAHRLIEVLRKRLAIHIAAQVLRIAHRAHMRAELAPKARRNILAALVRILRDRRSRCIHRRLVKPAILQRREVRVKEIVADTPIPDRPILSKPAQRVIDESRRHIRRPTHRNVDLLADRDALRPRILARARVPQRRDQQPRLPLVLVHRMRHIRQKQ
jgi:hypothetical protein